MFTLLVFAMMVEALVATASVLGVLEEGLSRLICSSRVVPRFSARLSSASFDRAISRPCHAMGVALARALSVILLFWSLFHVVWSSSRGRRSPEDLCRTVEREEKDTISCNSLILSVFILFNWFLFYSKDIKWLTKTLLTTRTTSRRKPPQRRMRRTLKSKENIDAPYIILWNFRLFGCTL